MTIEGKMTFTKFKVIQYTSTDKAVQCDIKISEQTNYWAKAVWIPRSNLRSDDDRRVDEFQLQLDSGTKKIDAFFHIADWYARKQGWLRTVES